MTFYNLFLDETKFFDQGVTTYGIAGVAIDKKNVRLMGEKLGKLKEDIWNDKLSYYQSKNIVLHMSDIRSANRRFNENYEIFNSREKIRKVFNGVAEIIDETDMTIFGSMVNLTELSNQFLIKSSYYLGDQICMENIVNNYTCFLKHNKSRGKIVFESRADKNNNNSDKMLKKQFYKIITHGTRIYKALEIQDVITDIRFIKKQENNAGLQIADFVPTHFLMNFNGKDQHKINIYKTLKQHRYSGELTKGGINSNRFGVTYIK